MQYDISYFYDKKLRVFRLILSFGSSKLYSNTSKEFSICQSEDSKHQIFDSTLVFNVFWVFYVCTEIFSPPSKFDAIKWLKKSFLVQKDNLTSFPINEFTSVTQNKLIIEKDLFQLLKERHLLQYLLNSVMFNSYHQHSNLTKILVIRKCMVQRSPGTKAGSSFTFNCRFLRSKESLLSDSAWSKIYRLLQMENFNFE